VSRRTPRAALSVVTRDSAIHRARRAWGLESEHLAAARNDHGAITLVTKGGRKLTYPGPVTRLTESEKDGQPRPAEHRGRLFPKGYLRRKLRRTEVDE
jgi:hypothetical protein